MFCLELQLRLLVKRSSCGYSRKPCFVGLGEWPHGMWEKIVQITLTVILLCKYMYSSSTSTEHISEALCLCISEAGYKMNTFQVPNTSKNWDCNLINGLNWIVSTVVWTPWMYFFWVMQFHREKENLGVARESKSPSLFFNMCKDKTPLK